MFIWVFIKSMDTILFDLHDTLIKVNMADLMSIYFREFSLAFQQKCDQGNLLELLLGALSDMTSNDGSKTNEMAFISRLSSELNCNYESCKELLESFYHNGFLHVKDTINPIAEMQENIKILVDKGYTLVLATNPVFSRPCVLYMMAWGGIEPSDFMYISTYENSRFCKPNPKYYSGILSELKLSPAKCMMVGNDAVEDIAAKQANIKAYLVTDYILNESNMSINPDYKGDRSAFSKFVLGLKTVH